MQPEQLVPGNNHIARKTGQGVCQDDAKQREGFEMSGQPRAVSRGGLEWVEVEFEAPTIGVVVNQYVGVHHGNIYHYRLERLDSVPAAVRLVPAQMWLTFFKDSTLLLE